MKRRDILIGVLLGTISLIIGCRKEPDRDAGVSSNNTEQQASTPTGDAKVKRVAILKLGAHALIDEVEGAIFRGLKDRYGASVKVSVFNANFEEDLLRQCVDQIVTSSFDVAVPITTDASVALVNAAPRKLKIVFSFVSSPQALWGQTGKQPVNVTGASDQIDYEKNLRLITTLFPEATRVGYLVNESEVQAKEGLKEVKELATNFGFTIVQGAIGSPGDVANAARSIVDSVDVFLVGRYNRKLWMDG